MQIQELPPSHEISRSSCLPCWLAVPGLIWMALFFLVPLGLVFAISFASRGTYGGILWEFTFANYLDLFHPLYGKILGQSMWYAGLTTAICFVLGFPLAYAIARSPARLQPFLLLLVMLPFWTNFLVRTYAWMVLLRQDGLINRFLTALGAVDRPLELLYTPTAVVIGLVYGYLPFMVLPLYVAVERLDPLLVEAAWDLYASRWAVFTRVVLPLTKPGIVGGCMLVFIPSVGSFITPDLLGGARSMMIGNLIQHEYLVVRDWPLGSAVSFVLMAVVMAAVVLYYRQASRADGPLEGR
ncbi:MAG: spermidine/putrescine import ABC transporter permease protein PotB [Nitrospira sp.]|nr:MAG: spermidine/putrescine import ABC transporter permease protein PotB [Nitrospira sp.]